ncbi:hypothetical protein A9Q81_04340 [Gammaproteobacteria bacterium 42_54_T18]|nr:hypothetical protein A9Q81_04340 [Gammaproteobacteria bacterium 42_54_T18]
MAHEMGEGAHVQVDLRHPVMLLQLEITLQEVMVIFDVDTNGDGRLLAEEYRLLDIAALAKYAINRLGVKADGQVCLLDITSHDIVEHTAGDFIRFRIQHSCEGVEETVSVDYHLFFDQNPYHQGTLTVIQPQQSSLLYFWDDQRTHKLSVENSNSVKAFFSSVALGFEHIWAGLDHLLFLLCLILPSVLVLVREDVLKGGKKLGIRVTSKRAPNYWIPARSLPAVIIDVAKVITAFTVAHSLTFMLSVMNWVPTPPSGAVELAIVLTIILVALNNLLPVVYRARWFVTLLLGFIHGFGFANGLTAYNLPSADAGWVLVAFNLGVEFGQLLFVCILIPFLFCLRQKHYYETVVLKGGSFFILGVSCLWLVERV